MEPMLLQQLTQILRLGHRPRKTVEHKSVAAIRPLDAFRDHLQHQRVRHQLAPLHDRLGLQAERRTFADMLPQHVPGRKMRYAVRLGQLFRLGTFSRSRGPQKNDRAVEFCIGTLFQRHGSSPLTTAAHTSLARETLVVPHDELCLELLHRVHRHAHHN